MKVLFLSLLEFESYADYDVDAISTKPGYFCLSFWCNGDMKVPAFIWIT